MKTKHLTVNDVADYKLSRESNSLDVELKNGKCFTLKAVRAWNFLKQIGN